MSRDPSLGDSKSDPCTDCSNLFATVPDLLDTVANPGDNLFDPMQVRAPGGRREHANYRTWAKLGNVGDFESWLAWMVNKTTREMKMTFWNNHSLE